MKDSKKVILKSLKETLKQLKNYDEIGIWDKEIISIKQAIEFIKLK